MKGESLQPQFANVLLTCTILLAQIDLHGLFEYALKACIGGAIWLGYKMVSDHLDRRRKAREAKEVKS